MGQADSKAVINLCLNCKVPAKKCNGRYPYCAGNYNNVRVKTNHGSKIKTIEKMIKSGYKRGAIQRELNLSSNELGSFISRLVKTNRLTPEEAKNSREK